jgi:hypothetical protein
MSELILYYIIPNVVMFGGLYALGKFIEKFTWKFIVWYCDNY